MRVWWFTSKGYTLNCEDVVLVAERTTTGTPLVDRRIRDNVGSRMYTVNGEIGVKSGQDEDRRDSVGAPGRQSKSPDDSPLESRKGPRREDGFHEEESRSGPVEDEEEVQRVEWTVRSFGRYFGDTDLFTGRKPQKVVSVTVT